MSADTTALRIDVADLLSHPAGRRAVHLEVPVEGLTSTAAAVPADEPVVLDLLLERVPDGIVVRGTLHTVWRAECSVCLADLVRSIDATVNELFEPEPVEGDTYPLFGHVIDLEQLVRDGVLLELPLAPACVDVGAPPCTPETPPDRDGAAVDPRWAALSELDL